MTLLRCSVCREEQPSSAFARNHLVTRGFSYRCKSCDRTWKKNFSQLHPDYYRQKAKETRGKYPERHRQRALEWQKKNPEKKQIIQQRYAEKHLERIRLSRKRFAEKHPGQHYQRYAEVIKQRVKEWRQNNRDRKNMHEVIRRGRKLGRGSFAQEEWQELCARYDHRCLACHTQKRLTVDHVIPLSKGGMNTLDNLQPLCVSCNSKKWLRIVDYRGQALAWIERAIAARKD